MSQDMNRFSGNRRSKLTALTGYLLSAGYSTPSPGGRGISSQNIQEDSRQGWRSWAGDKARKLGNGGWRTPTGNDPSDNVEIITLFPGWAARRYRKHIPGESLRPFEVEVFSSGYATSHKNRDTMSRAQRAFIRVAKGFAALPNLPSLIATEPAPLSKSTEELLSQIHLPPRPEEITDGYDMDDLDRQFRRAQLKSLETSSGTNTPPASSNAAESDSSPVPSAASSTRNLVSALKKAEECTSSMLSAPATSSAGQTTAEALRRMHANLESRLQPFWSSILCNRTVRLHLFVSPHHETPSSPGSVHDEQPRPLASVDATTAADGSLQAKFVVNWDDLCHHPTALHIAFGEAVEEHTLVVIAELLKPQPAHAVTRDSPGYTQYQSPRRQNQEALKPTTRCQILIPITHCPIRVISDIDDTVKDSGILNGARAVFRNVFVKDLGDCVVPEMGEWYTDMWSKGIRFHYVSNGPYEYLSVLNEFFPLSKLPPGSIKLRSFAGRSLFNGFFSTPSAKKRAGVEDILKAFPDSQFFLIGDSGEQDLELYAELSQKYMNNVLGVFIRDVTTVEGVTDLLDDPTGWNAIAVQSINPDDRGGGDELPPAGYPYSPSPVRSRRSVTNILADVGRRSSNSLSSFLSSKEKSGDNKNVFAEEDAFFTSATSGDSLSTEPDVYGGSRIDPGKDVYDGPTPRLGSVPVMENPQTVSVGAVINEPPKPILPLSLRYTTAANDNTATSSDASSLSHKLLGSESQRTGESSSAASSNGSVDNQSKMSTASGLVLPTSGMSPDERRRNELQMRVWRARTVMPGNVKLRIFRKPRECVEAGEILQMEAKSSS